MSALHVGAAPKELVPGDPDALHRMAARLGVLADGLGMAAAQLRVIHSGDWFGRAAEAFDAVVGQEPARYEVAAAAFGIAGGALTGYAATLQAAQDQAQRAVAVYEDAVAETRRWREATIEPAWADPGAGERARAEGLLSEARAWVDEAGSTAAGRLTEACEGAPREPSVFEQVAGRVWGWASELVGGAAEATVDLGELVWDTSNLRLVLDPDGWQRDIHELAEGVGYGITHPVELAQAVVDWDTWTDSPLRAVGHLAPDLVLALITGGAGNAGTVARRVAFAATVATRLRDAENEAVRTRAREEEVAFDPRLVAAIDRTVDIGRITPAPVWRTTDEPLYRADSRPPEVVFEQGFAPRDPSRLDLATFVAHGDASGFVSTTRSPSLILDFETAYWYSIDAPGGIDVNATLGEHVHAFEEEIAFPGGVDRRFIIGAQPYDAETDQLGRFVPNPSYEPVP